MGRASIFFENERVIRVAENEPSGTQRVFFGFKTGHWSFVVPCCRQISFPNRTQAKKLVSQEEVHNQRVIEGANDNVPTIGCLWEGLDGCRGRGF